MGHSRSKAERGVKEEPGKERGVEEEPGKDKGKLKAGTSSRRSNETPPATRSGTSSGSRRNICFPVFSWRSGKPVQSPKKKKGAEASALSTKKKGKGGRAGAGAVPSQSRRRSGRCIEGKGDGESHDREVLESESRRLDGEQRARDELLFETDEEALRLSKEIAARQRAEEETRRRREESAAEKLTEVLGTAGMSEDESRRRETVQGAWTEIEARAAARFLTQTRKEQDMGCC